MIARWKLLAGCALASAVPVPAAAQLASPVATTQQAANPLARGAAAAQVAVPPAEVAPHQPTVIEAPASAPAEQPRDVPGKPAPPTPPSEFEAFVSAAAGTPLRASDSSE